MTTKEVEKIKETWKPYMRVRLTKDMQDPFTEMKAGSEGIVTGVDDIGTVFVRWDCGSGLGLISGTDEWELVKCFDTRNLPDRIREYAQMQDKADELIEYLSEHGSCEGESIIEVLAEIKASLAKEIRDVVTAAYPIFASEWSIAQKGADSVRDWIMARFDDGDYAYVELTVRQFEETANK